MSYLFISKFDYSIHKICQILVTQDLYAEGNTSNQDFASSCEVEEHPLQDTWLIAKEYAWPSSTNLIITMQGNVVW